MEGTAARLAAERGADPEIADQCRNVLDELDGTLHERNDIDFPAYVRLNAEYHRLLGFIVAKPCGNARNRPCMPLAAGLAERISERPEDSS